MNYTDGYNTVPTYRFALRSDLKDDNRFLPTRAHDTDTGWDVRAAMPDRKPLVISPFQRVMIPLGFRAIPPAGYWYQLHPRSSTFAKKMLHSLIGTIDFGFENELQFAAQYIPSFDFDNISVENGKMINFLTNRDINQALTINFGDAIGQLIPVRRQEMTVEGISNEQYDAEVAERNASRKTGGFGSSGS